MERTCDRENAVPRPTAEPCGPGTGTKLERASLSVVGVFMPRKVATLAVVDLVVIWGLIGSVLLGFCLAAGAGELPPLEARHRIRAYLVAMSPLASPDDRNDWGGRGNQPKKLDRTLPANALSLRAFTEETLPFKGSHRGFRVILANTTADAVSVPTVDSVLRIVREALDPSGAWKPIEYIFNSTCGNSYYPATLPSGHYWSFVAPEYAGPMKTRMRFVLEGEDGRPPLHSNEFEGSIDPGQFTFDPEDPFAP